MRCHGFGLTKPALADTAAVSQHLAKLRMVGATRTTLSIGILTEDTSATTVMDMRIGMDTRRTPTGSELPYVNLKSPTSCWRV